MVVIFSEYKGFISWVVVLFDYVFFIIGGYDGMVKVWDIVCLERNIMYRLR